MFEDNRPVLIVVGTNRPDANTDRVARYYQRLLATQGAESRLLSLRDLPTDFVFSALYDRAGQNADFNRFQQMVDETDRFVFVVPEYNGSFPGVLKAFLDGLKYPDSLRDKVGALVGLAAGVQGGSAALSHLSDVLSYMGLTTLALRVQMGNIYQHLEGEDITFPVYRELLARQATQLLATAPLAALRAPDAEL